MSRDPADRPAPEPLELVRAFVNTRDIDKGIDHLAAPAAASAWLVDAGLLPAGSHVDRYLRTKIVRAREAFRAVLVANAAGGEAADAVAVLNAVATDAGVVLRLSRPDRAKPVVLMDGIDGALGRLVAIAFEAIAMGTWSRLKACPSRTCHWAYYDTSRNRSSRWCDMGVCGNRAKRATFRERNRPCRPTNGS